MGERRFDVVNLFILFETHYIIYLINYKKSMLEIKRMSGSLHPFKWDISYILLNLRNSDLNIYMCALLISEFGIEEKLSLNLA